MPNESGCPIQSKTGSISEPDSFPVTALSADSAAGRFELLHDGIHAEAARLLARRILQEGFQEFRRDQPRRAQGVHATRRPVTPADPFETGPRETIGWGYWSARRMYTLSAAGLIATEFLKTFLEYPPRQEPGSFSVDAIMEQLESARSRLGG